MISPVLKIDPEFQAKIPPLTEEEFKQLEENILHDGEVYDPIIIWNSTIVDGHNRYKIIQEHPWLEWHVKEMKFADRYEAIAWMCGNQLGRRNIDLIQRKLLIGLQNEAQKMSHGGDRRSDTFSSGNSFPLKTTERVSEAIGKEYGLTGRSVRNYASMARGYNDIQKASPETAAKIISGQQKIHDIDLQAIDHASPEEKPAMIQAVIENRRVPRSSEKTATVPAAPLPPASGGKSSDANSEETRSDSTGFSKINWRSAEGRRVKEQIDQAIRDSYSDETPEFTLQMLIEELNLDVQDFTDKLSRMLTDRADIITESIRIETKNVLHNLKKYKEALNNGK